MTDAMDEETRQLIQRWIVRFCEMPVLVDRELMRAVLDDPANQGNNR